METNTLENMNIESIKVVSHLLWPKRKLRIHDNDFDCPYCDGKGKLNVNYDKNVFRCNKCGEHGSYLKLYSKITGNSFKKAQEDINSGWHNMSSDEKKMICAIGEEEDEPPSGILSRDLFYTVCLNSCGIKDEHKADLLRRGLDEKSITDYKIKSFDEAVMTNCFNSVAKRVEGLPYISSVRIPGFYMDEDGVMKCVSNEGYMIPVLNRKGLISCIQIRHFEGDVKEKKYTYLSSKYKNLGVGVSGCENVHYAGFSFTEEATPRCVNLTEGCLKADVASFLSGRAFIAIMGVNNTSQLSDELRYLKEHGTEEINICLDMDYRDKPQVAKALENIKRIIESCGLKYNMLVWPEEYKGIDDYLLSRKKDDRHNPERQNLD